MIRVIYGEKGMGKTKIIIESANKMAEEIKGDIVFLDHNTKLMYDLNRRIRFTNISEFQVKGQSAFIGFLSGVLSQNYDIEVVYIDGLNYILDQGAEELKSLFDNLKSLSEKTNTKFFITINGKNQEMPEYLKEYIA